MGGGGKCKLHFRARETRRNSKCKILCEHSKEVHTDRKSYLPPPTVHPFCHTPENVKKNVFHLCAPPPPLFTFIKGWGILIPQVLGGYPPPPTGASIMSISDLPPGPQEGPGTSIKPENTVNIVFFVCFDTHLLSGHCRASTVSIIDTQGLGGVSRRPRDAPTGAHHEPFISPGPSGPSSGASADAHEGLVCSLGGGVRGAGNAVNTVFFACCAKNCSKTPRYGCRVCTQRQTSEKVFFLEKTLVSSCFWPCFATFGPHPQAADANDAVARARARARARRGLYVGFRLSLPVLSSLLPPVHCFFFHILFLCIPCLLIFSLLFVILLLSLLLLILPFPFLLVIIISFLLFLFFSFFFLLFFLCFFFFFLFLFFLFFFLLFFFFHYSLFSSSSSVSYFSDSSYFSSSFLPLPLILVILLSLLFFFFFLLFFFCLFFSSSLFSSSSSSGSSSFSSSYFLIISFLLLFLLSLFFFFLFFLFFSFSLSS